MIDATEKLTVLCVGPTGAPMTGQAHATKTWSDASRHTVFGVDTNFEGRSSLVKLLFSLLVPLKVFFVARRVKPDALYLSVKRSILGCTADFLSIVSFRLNSAGPIVVHLHGADLSLLRRTGLGRWLSACTFRSVSDVIILSRGMEDQLAGLPLKRIHVVANFSDVFYPYDLLVGKVEKFSGSRLNVLFLSNIMYSKGFVHLIDAVRSSRRKGYDIRLRLVGKPLGDGYMSSSEALKVVRASANDGIEYLGPLYGADKHSVLAWADVVALPSFYPTEAQPICLIEGMAFGCVPLSTEHNYNADFLDSEAASLVEKDSVSAIEAELEKFILAPTRTRGRMWRSRQMAWNFHRPEKFVQSIDQIIARSKEHWQPCS